MKQIVSKVFSLFLILVLLGLIACTPVPSETNTGSTTGDSSETVRVVIFYRGGEKTDFSYANGVLRELGYALSFEAVDLNSFRSMKAIETFIRTGIEDGDIFLALRGLGFVKDILEEDEVLGDFYELGKQVAPNYMETAQVVKHNRPGTLISMPTDFWLSSTFNPPAVLVREDVALKYGKEIRTASQYVDLLRWIKEQEPDSIPGVTFRDYGTSFTPYFLFLPEMGYWANGAGQWLLFAIGTNDVYPTYSVAEAKAAIEDYHQLWREGYLYLKNYPDDPAQDRPFDDFPTMLTYVYSFHGATFTQFDASGYRMYTLYNDYLPELIQEQEDTAPPNLALAGKDADVSDFLQFMEWLGNSENYRRFFYGVEDVDYTTNDQGRIVPANSNVDWAAIRTGLWFLEREAFYEVPLNAPMNYEQEIASLKPGYILKLEEMDGGALEALNEWYAANIAADTSKTEVFMSDLWDLHARAFNHSQPPSANILDLAIDQYLQAQSAKSELIEEYARLWKDYLSHANMLVDIQ